MQVTDQMLKAAHALLPGVMNAERLRKAIQAALDTCDQEPEIPVTAKLKVMIDGGDFERQIVEAVNRLADGLPKAPDGAFAVAEFDAVLPASALSPGEYILADAAKSYTEMTEEERAELQRQFEEAMVHPMRILNARPSSGVELRGEHGPELEFGVLAPPSAYWPPTVTDNGLEGDGVRDATGQATITVNEPRVLAGLAEIATATHAGRSTVNGWIKGRKHNGMPEPVAALACGPVFDLDAVTAWHAKWKSGESTIGVNDGGR